MCAKDNCGCKSIEKKCNCNHSKDSKGCCSVKPLIEKEK